MTSYYDLDPKHTQPSRLKKEREKARQIKKSNWWITQLSQGICHYCQKQVLSHQLTLDHIVPLARGGRSVQNNIVPACQSCNQSKKLNTPVDLLLQSLKS